MEIPTFEEIFKPIKSNFWFTGICFDDPKIKIRYFVLMTFLIMVDAEEIAFFIVKISTANFLELTQLAPCTLIGILSILKFCAITMSRRKIFKLTKNLENLYQEIVSDQEKVNFVKKEISLGKKLTKCYFFLNALLISVYNFSSLLIIGYNFLIYKNIQFTLPYAVVVPFEIDNWLNWSIVYVHSIIAGFICVLFFTTVDALYCILTSHICIHFSLLSNQILLLNKHNTNLLRDIVKKHQYLLDQAGDLEDIFTAPNLLNLLVGSIQICALGFNLTTGDWTQIPGSVLFLVSVMIQILMMSVFGEDLIVQSRKIGEAAFFCKWYEMDEKSKKTLLIIILRSHRPCRLTAYKFSVISYGSFNKVLSSSWSYFTILRTVYVPDANVSNE